MLILTLLVAASASGQPFGNEWINYDQQYWRFPVSASAFYKITYQALLNSGFPVGDINPQNIQVFGRGKQVHIKISGEDDQSFDTTDYLEVYALRNDGWIDSLMYDTPAHQPHKDYSLFNDTAHYFITVAEQPGLRTEIFSQNNYADFTPQPYCIKRNATWMTSQYLYGKQDGNGISLPWYEEGEGWFDYNFYNGQTHEKIISTQNAFTGNNAPDAVVKTVSAGVNNASGPPFNHHLQVAWGNDFNVMHDTLFNAYQLNKLQFAIPASGLNATTLISHRIVDDLMLATDYQSVAHIAIEYAHTFDFEAQLVFPFRLLNLDNTAEAYLEISNYNAGADTHRMFIQGNGALKEILLTQEGGLLKAIVPFSNGESALEMLLFSSAVQNLTDIIPVTPSGYFTNYSATELDSAFIIITHPKLWTAAQNYASYRSAGLPVLLANVEELYMQYAAGIWKHPLAIRRFCNHLLQNWDSEPSHLFLLGKSIREMSATAANGARNNPDFYARNLVPTMGYPPSDNALTAGLNGTFTETAIATGRLAAENPQQVLEYLNKVVEQEAHSPELWQKNIMHFGGGGASWEQSLIANYLHGYELTAEDTSFGAQVYTFLKTTTDPIQITLSDSVQQLINEGVAVMTFFGHASSTGFDQNIDQPESYTNQGKYPLLVGNSCYNGNIHLPDGVSTSENFVLVPDRGVIGFLAKPDLGISQYLDSFTANFYREIFQSSYGKSVGQCIAEAVKNFQDTGANDYLLRANIALAMTLHGDPAIRLYPHEAPDYSIEPAQISFYPEIVTAQVDSFEVRIEIQNLGKAVNNDVFVELIRHYPSGADSSYTQIATHVFNSTTVVFTLPIDPINGVGQNLFDVFIDYPVNFVEELDETGNNIVTGKQLLISSGNLVPVYPFDFAVIPQNQVSLFASTGYAFEPERTYLFQLDTIDSFDSPQLMATNITQSGGVLQWDVPITLTDSTVYFWRCSPDSISMEESFKWRGSSFQYIEGKEGWGQAHFRQFQHDGFSRIVYNEIQNTFDFSTTNVELQCDVYGNPNTSYETLGTRYQLDLEVQDYSGCGLTPALMVAVIDSVTLEPWETNYNNTNPQNDFGNEMSCTEGRQRTEKYFIFYQTDADQLAGFVDMIENHVPDGNYLLIYAWNFTDYNAWETYNPDVFDVFENLGATQIGVAQDSVPFIFFTKMGHPETTIELYGSSIDDHLVLEVELTGQQGTGTLRSPEIGPALSWKDVFWDVSPLEATAGDSTRIKLYGIAPSGTETWIADWPQFPQEYLDLETLVNAQQFPKLRLEASLHDTLNLTPPQMESWHILHEEVPEAALDPASGFYFSSDSISEGAPLQLAIAIRNISPTDMDSLLVKYWVEDAQHEIHSVPYSRQAPLLIGSTLLDTIPINSYGLKGNCFVWMEVNPVNDINGTFDQPEQHHFNNITQLAFTVVEDNINPILDVTFDGQHILNGDIVSAQPHILISLDDENLFFIMNEEADTSNFRVYLTTPSLYDVPVYFSSAELEWTAATAPKNKFRMDYTPTFTVDGEYSLRVQASDKSGNNSGDYDYRIEFEIITKPSITEVLNYPNPFSTHTQFVFTLTGTEVPDQVKIQIMTIGGKVVREILQSELGLLHIGRNVTEFAWDGRDEYGDQLANGVYLYRVVAKLNGESLEIRESGASRFITKGMGKMYLMR
ncbi:MAG: C25 family cysteine peptidase [Flavobacteriales bacterium]|nr:C25 family cysteine peptidase [Flavobacteriales bacterium]